MPSRPRWRGACHERASDPGRNEPATDAQRAASGRAARVPAQVRGSTPGRSGGRDEPLPGLDGHRRHVHRRRRLRRGARHLPRRQGRRRRRTTSREGVFAGARTRSSTRLPRSRSRCTARRRASTPSCSAAASACCCWRRAAPATSTTSPAATGLRLYDLHYRKPTPLVPRRDIVEIGGRLGCDGAELEPLDEDAVRDAAAPRARRGLRRDRRRLPLQLRRTRPTSCAREELILEEELATSPSPSRTGRARVARVRAHLVGGHRCATPPRSCAATSSGSSPSCSARGLGVPLHVMQSSGGIVTAASARQRSLQTLLSGPVGGDDGRRRAGAHPGPTEPHLHRHGRHQLRRQPGRRRQARRLLRDDARGLPAADDDRQHPHDRRRRRLARLRRGRRAARRARGARAPTPAPPATGVAARSRPSPTPTSCSAASIPADFAGGQMSLDVAAAETAVAGLAAELGLGTQRARRGHLRRHQREDGAGDPHADRREGHRAARLRTRRVRRRRADARRLPGPRARASPRSSSRPTPVRSPRGACWRPRSARTSRSPTSPRSPPLDRADLAADPRGARGGGLRQPRPRRASRARTGRVEHALDIRYVGQEYTLTIPLLGAGEPLEPGFDAALATRFHEAHETRFGHANAGAPVELVVVRTTALGDLGRAEPVAAPLGAPDAYPRGAREAVFDGQKLQARFVHRDRPRAGRGRRGAGDHHGAHCDDGRARRAHACGWTPSARSSCATGEDA